MRFPVLLAIAIAAALPAAAQIAKGAGALLTQDEARKALLGICMEGVSPTFRMEWKEFISRDGETLYETPDRKQKGRFVVDVNGQACFAYEDTNYEGWSCFTVQRAGRNGFVFNSEEGGGVFVTTSVRRNARSCNSDDLIG